MANVLPTWWEGSEVSVVHPIATGDVGQSQMSVGSTRGVLEEIGDEGVVLRVQHQSRSEELHYFPWSAIIKIIQPFTQQHRPSRGDS